MSPGISVSKFPIPFGGGISVVTYSPEYESVLAAMPTEPSIADKTIQSTMLKALVDGGYYAKAELLDIFSTPTADSSLINWKSPGTFNPSLVSDPTFQAYGGYAGNVVGTKKYVRTNFIPSVNGTLIGQDNICVIVGVGSDNDGDMWEFGAVNLGATTFLRLTARNLGEKISMSCNSGTEDGSDVGLNAIAHLAVSRGAAANFERYKNSTKKNIAQASTGYINVELHACGWNFNGNAQPSTRQVRYAFVFSYLTEAEVQGVMTIMESYLDNYGMGLI